MLNELLRKHNIQILDSVADWQEAIASSVQPLINAGDVEARYVQGIIDNTLEHGPYYVLAPDIAMPHARSDQGVINRAIGITILKRPVLFSEDSFSVRLLVVLAATDPLSHIEALKELSGLLMDEEKVAQLIEAKSIDEIYRIVVGER